jgi:hypothetical protein
MSIYVDCFIQGSMDTLWHKTQIPDLHERWDLRFTHIEYLPRASESEPQKFLYVTRIGFGVEIRGEGETVGKLENDHERTSALKFWSDDPKSLIREGSGYWKYFQQPTGIRFLTRYDYRTRFGAPGRIFDRLIFRPLLGWATAWSFDRLRLWIEKDIDPSISLRNSLVHALARLTLAFIWFYHGLVPKLIFEHRDELVPLLRTGISPDVALTGVRVAGVAEIGLALLMLVAWNRRWPLLINVGLMVVALIAVAVTTPEFLIAAFNPVTLNLSVIVLSLIAYIAGVDLPSARRCLRKRPERES